GGQGAEEGVGLMPIRQPTPAEVMFAWYRDRLDGTETCELLSVHDLPQCGWFKAHLVGAGPWVPARIWLEQEIDPLTGELIDDERLLCEVNGGRRDPYREWERLCGNPVPKAEYDYLIRLRLWAAWHAPDDPAANPRRPIDWLRVRPPTFAPAQK